MSPTSRLTLVLGYMTDLERSRSSEKLSRILRKMYSLTESEDSRDLRVDMVSTQNSVVATTLLNFLFRSERGSTERSLALLVLNNLCIPEVNKRIIAMDCKGATLLARMLCDDPSCHLIAIVLVNLTNADEKLRRDLAMPEFGVELVEALAFSLRVASLTQQQYEHRIPLVEDPENMKSPKELLTGLIAEDERQLSDLSRRNYSFSAHCNLFPDTVKWCLVALKNLMRAGAHEAPAVALINSGAVPLILKFVTMSVDHRAKSSHDDSLHSLAKIDSSLSHNGDSTSSSFTPAASDPLVPVGIESPNIPCTWEVDGPQDSSLYVVLHLAAVAPAKHAIHEAGGVAVLSEIVLRPFGDEQKLSSEEIRVARLQQLKARIALAYLIGSEGHFGQRRKQHFASPSSSNAVLLLSESEALALIDMIANIMHGRGADGAAGYSSCTFTLSQLLLAVRCFLTQHSNQVLLSEIAGTSFNFLLFKAIIFHLLVEDSGLDDEAASNACFSLYLMSSYGFEVCASACLTTVCKANPDSSHSARSFLDSWGFRTQLVAPSRRFS